MEQNAFARACKKRKAEEDLYSGRPETKLRQNLGFVNEPRINEGSIITVPDLSLSAMEFVPLDVVFRCSFCTCRIWNRSKTASGFLITLPSPTSTPLICILTNNHVIKTPTEALECKLQFNYGMKISHEVQVNPDKLFVTNAEMDYSIIAVDENSYKSYSEFNKFFSFEPIDLSKSSHISSPKDKVMIFQHPKGEKQQLCMGEIVMVSNAGFLYSVSTLPGSSGSMVLDVKTLSVIGVHSSRVADSRSKVKYGSGFLLNHIKKDFESQLSKIENIRNFVYRVDPVKILSASGKWKFSGKLSCFYAIEFYFDFREEKKIGVGTYVENLVVSLKFSASRESRLYVRDTEPPLNGENPFLSDAKNWSDRMCVKGSGSEECMSIVMSTEKKYYFYLIAIEADTDFQFCAEAAEMYWWTRNVT